MVINFNIAGGNGGGGATLNSVIANIYVTDELVADTATTTNFVLAGDGVDFNIWGNSEKPVVAALYAHGGLFEENPAVIPVTLTGNYADDPDQLFINFILFETVYYFKVGITGDNTGTLTFTSSADINNDDIFIYLEDFISRPSELFNYLYSNYKYPYYYGKKIFVSEYLNNTLLCNVIFYSVGNFYISFLSQNLDYILTYTIDNRNIKIGKKNISASNFNFNYGIASIIVKEQANGDASDSFTDVFMNGYKETSNFDSLNWVSIKFTKGFINSTFKLFSGYFDSHGHIKFIYDGYIFDYIYNNSSFTLKFNTKTKIGGANIYDLTDLTVEQETAIYNEMESASTWDNDASIYKYTGDGQFQMCYTDGTIINFDSFYWANRPARWVFNGSFTDNNGHAYNVEYYLYGDESSEPYVDYTPAVKFDNNALTYYTGNTAYNVVDSTDVKHVKVLTSAQYTALTSKDANTLYCIKG